MTTPGLRAARAVFAIADHIAPRITARIAFEVFCRTRNPRAIPKREREAILAAADFMRLARHHHLRSGHGARAVAHEFRPTGWRHGGQTILVIHGWDSRTEHMRVVIEALLRLGRRVVALDLPGHGMSPGRRNNLVLSVEATALAAQWFGPFEAIVGHSFGGAVAVNAATGSVVGALPVLAERLVLIAAPNSMPGLFEGFGRFLSLGPKTQTAMADIVYRLGGRPLGEYVSALLLNDAPLPTLVIHAPDDKEIPFADALALETAGAFVTLQRAPGLGHRRILADQGIADEAARFATGQGTITRKVA